MMLKSFGLMLVWLCGLIVFTGLTAPDIEAQTTQFSYQGNLNTSGSPSNGAYDFEFRLFDATSGGSQVGTTNVRNAVNVANGTFSVVLDFQSSSFPGANRFMEISVRTSGGGSFTTLAPRTQVNSTPYAIQSGSAGTAQTAANALSLNGVSADQYVLNADPRPSNSRPPTSGSADYIQNKTGTPQANANLTIDGTATATNVNAFQFYQLNSQRILFTQAGNNLFLGPNIALNNSGINNTFFGTGAGTANTTGGGNTILGRNAGTANTTGNSNTLIGNMAGGQNQSGSFNVYVGQNAGQSNPSGQENTYIGPGAGATSPSGSQNVAIGADAGNGTPLGSNNTFVGRFARPTNPNLSFATAIGSGATVTQSNTIALGRDVDLTYVAGILQLGNGAAGASQTLCVTATGQVGLCASSQRYKSNIASFKGGMDIVSRLRPVTFDWTKDKLHDVGFIAEDVARIEPLLARKNDNGEIDGVKYDRFTAVLVNALKEQKTEIDQLRARLENLEKMVIRSRTRSRKGPVRRKRS